MVGAAGGQLAQIDPLGHRPGLQRRALGARQRQQLLCQAAAALGRQVQALQRGLQGRGMLAGEQLRRLDAHDGPGRAQLVRGIGHEGALRASGLAQPRQQGVQRLHKAGHFTRHAAGIDGAQLPRIEPADGVGRALQRLQHAMDGQQRQGGQRQRQRQRAEGRGQHGGAQGRRALAHGFGHQNGAHSAAFGARVAVRGHAHRPALERAVEKQPLAGGQRRRRQRRELRAAPQHMPGRVGDGKHRHIDEVGAQRPGRLRADRQADLPLVVLHDLRQRHRRVGQRAVQRIERRRQHQHVDHRRRQRDQRGQRQRQPQPEGAPQAGACHRTPSVGAAGSSR